MNLTLLQEAAPAAAEGGAAGIMGGNGFWIMMILIFVVMYFFMIRPQQKRQKELKKFRESLQKGDKIVTIGGIYGTISEVKDNFIIVEVDNNVRMRFDKSSVLKDS
ncbi:MAG: preprotein translocase subunit YajC, partial [Prevotellaceae bacterium]|nr:preprotein translocase subunit YajC [Prevotellaceae bacterium]